MQIDGSIRLGMAMAGDALRTGIQIEELKRDGWVAPKR